MNRRDLLLFGAASALAHTATAVVGCAAQSTSSSTSTTPVAPEARAALQRAAAECVRAGEACLSHCVRSLSSGNTMMAECASSVREMLAICRAVESLATTESTQLQALARICLATCTRCEAACSPHADHHTECGDCARACRATIAAAAAVVG